MFLIRVRGSGTVNLNAIVTVTCSVYSRQATTVYCSLDAVFIFNITVPAHGMKKYGERRGIAPVILSLSIRWSYGQRQVSIDLPPVLTEYEVGGLDHLQKIKIFSIYVFVFST